MGLCASTGAHADDGKLNAVNPQDISVRVNEKDSKEIDADFREILRSGLCLILERLYTAVGYEADGYLDIVRKQGLDDIMDLVAPQHFETFFREHLEIKDQQPSSLDEHHMNFKQDKALNFIQAVKVASWKNVVVSRKDMVQQAQTAAKRTQEQLKASCDACDSSDLKIHMQFFSAALDFLAGDITKDSVLYDNIDRICDE